MSRTVDPSTCRRMTVYSVILLFIAFCLVAHFLVEDVLLLRTMDASSRTQSTAGLAFEMEHQDDLVLAPDLPEFLPRSGPPAISVWTFHENRSFAFPIRIPPKIA